MNNNGQMENIWHHIRKNTSRRAMRSLVKLGIVVWVVLLGLIGFCLYQGTQWWHLNADINNTIRSIRPTIDHQLKSLREDINLKMHRLAFLEEQALLSQNKDLISWMTEQAEVSKTQMIGVEHLKERQVEQYLYSPIEFTFRGDYQSLGQLVNQLERSQYLMKLDYLSVATRENSHGSLVMNIVIVRTGLLRKPRSISTIGEPTTKIQNKEPFPAVSVPPQSSEHRFNYIGADFVYPKGNVMRDVFQPYYLTPQAKNELSSPSLILTGVIYNENKPLAIFMDGQNKSYLARVNDTILDFTVLKIEPRSVILNRGDTRTELKVFKDKEIGATF